MPKGQAPRLNRNARHKTLLKRYSVLQNQLESMKGNLEPAKDAPNASVGKKMLRRYRNTMISIGQSLNSANPVYRNVEKKLRTVGRAIDDISDGMSNKRSKQK